MSERNFTILDRTFTVAESITTIDHGNTPISTNGITMQAIFTHGSGGTTAKAFVQTSLDEGVTWFDIASFAFATTSATKIINLSGNTPVTTQVVPVDGALTDNTVVDGLIGAQFRARYVTTGTYSGDTTLKIDVRLHR